jgi:hypothetical protein
MPNGKDLSDEMRFLHDLEDWKQKGHDTDMYIARIVWELRTKCPTCNGSIRDHDKRLRNLEKSIPVARVADGVKLYEGKRLTLMVKETATQGGIYTVILVALYILARLLNIPLP